MCTRKGSPYSITERRVPELIPVLGSQPASDVSHKPGGRPQLPSQPLRGLLPILLLGTMGVNSLPNTVTRQRRDCDLNPGPSAPESSTLTTRLPSHPVFDAEQNDPGIRQLTPMCPHLIYFGPLESAARTASRSVQRYCRAAGRD